MLKLVTACKFLCTMWLLFKMMDPIKQSFQTPHLKVTKNILFRFHIDKLVRLRE